MLNSHLVPDNSCTNLAAFILEIHINGNDLKPDITLFYSDRKLFTGFARAALIDWKLTVIKAIKTAPSPATANIHQLMLTL